MLGGMFGLGPTTTDLSRRVLRLEAQVAAQRQVIEQLCARLDIRPEGLDPVCGLDAEERALVEAGEKVAAMRHHRARTGSSLVEARDAVESRPL